MKFQVLYVNALKALRKNKKRSILTMLGIIIGIAAVIAIISIGGGFEDYVVSNIFPNDDKELKVSVFYMPNETDLLRSGANITYFSKQDLHAIQQIEGVEKVAFAKNEIGSISVENMVNGKKVLVSVGIDETVTNEKILEGRNLTQEDMDLGNRVIVISESSAKELFPGATKYINRGMNIEGVGYTIVGITPGQAFSMFSQNSDAHIPKNAYLKHHQESALNNQIDITVAIGASANDVLTEATNYLKEHGSMRNEGKYESFDMNQIMEGIGKVLSGVTTFISLIGGISLFIAGIGMMNMMYISVSERTQEIGVRRALGATKKEIRMQFLLEGVTVTVIGGILGYLFGLLLGYIISLFLPFSIRFDLGPILLALGISLAIGIVFSYAPARAAANKNVIEIL